MPGFARAGLSAALLLALLAGHAHAFGGRWTYTASYSYPVYSSAYYPAYYSVPAVSYYVPAWPIYVAPAAVCTPTVIVPAPAAPLYAVPTPAPPSQTVEPPAIKTRSNLPTVSESYSGSALKTVQVGSAGKERIQVGFWNVSGRDVTLTINGRAYFLPRNRSITLALSRRFTWHIDQRTLRTENVPQENSTLEIVLRQ